MIEVGEYVRTKRGEICKSFAIKAKIEEVKDGTFDAKIVLQSLLKKE